MSDDERWVKVGPTTPMPDVKTSLGERLFRMLNEKSIDPIVINGATGECLSSDEVLRRGISFALELRARGVQPGDVVSPVLENCIEFSFMMLGTFLAGCILAPVNPKLDANDLNHIFRMLNSRIILTLPKDTAKIKPFKPPHAEIVEVDYQSGSWKKIIERKDIKGFAPTAVKDMDAPLLVLCSSGTTGVPKGVIATQRLMVGQREMDWLRQESGASVNIMVTPIFWASGVIFTLIMLDKAETQVFLPSFDADTYLKCIEKYKVTTGMLAPQHVAAIAKCPNPYKYDISSLKYIMTGGAPVSLSVKEEAEKIMKLRIVVYYGQTEAMYPFLVHGPKSPEKPLTCGMIGPNCSVKVADINTGQALGPNNDGEICVKMPVPFAGYFNNPDAINDIVLSDGWHHTGDVGYYDEDGYFFVNDRIKELIKYKGTHLTPGEIENVLLANPGVRDAAVVGVFHDIDQERSVGFVVKQPGAEVTKEKLLQEVKDNLAEYKWLHGGLYFVDEIPRTASGKILRRTLRQEAAKLVKE